MKLELSTKHIKLRIFLAVLFFVIAVTAFTVGVLNIGKKSAGYQSIEGNPDAEALLYNNAVGYKYFFDGTSNEIKREIRALKTVYTPILSAFYKQLDHHNVYTGQVSIGTINQNAGKEVSVSPELYAVLKDAYKRTLEKKGFNMFAGALYSEWDSILILEEPDDFDPLVNKSQADRLSAIAAEVSNLDNFTLEFLDDKKCTVRFSVSEKYSTFCREYEIDAFALNLNLLEDAYRLSMMADALVSAGYELGYLYTKEGLVLNTSPRGSLGYGMYTLENGNAVKYAELSINGVFSASAFTAFGYGSYYHYSIDADGKTRYRHRYFDVETGLMPEVLMSVCVLSSDMNLVENAYQSIILANLDSEADVEAYAKTLEAQGRVVSYVLQSVK